MISKRKKLPAQSMHEQNELKDFYDLIMPATVRFFPDYYILSDSYRCAWAIREYPPVTSDQAILSRFGENESVTLHIYIRTVDAMEQRKIIQNATRKNRMMTGATDIQDTITAQGNLDDVVELLSNMRRNKEPLMHCAVFIELAAPSMERLKELQSETQMELTRNKMSVDRLTLRQREGFISVMPTGYNAFDTQFERVIPASSAANLYPFNYSGKTDPKGFYIGKDKFGTNILVDLDRRADDKTNANTLILGNSGQGKSYLMKLILTNLRASGKNIICLDPESEYEELTKNLGGCYLDFLSGSVMINPLEPKIWNDTVLLQDEADSPDTFNRATRLSQHISFLKDFFKSYKDFPDALVDTIEIMLMKLYARYGITDSTDFGALLPKNYPVMSDLYVLIEQEYHAFDRTRKHLYTEEMLQEICLGLHSMCRGAESKYFNGHTNITDDRFLCFGVKGIMETNKRLKDAILFNILSYMSNALLTKGNTVAGIDELYMFLSNLTAIEYIRNACKRVRKKDSAVILASQNIEDFLLEGISEYTKPLFSIPTHQFLFNAGNIDPRIYMDTLQIEPSEFDLIRYPERGTCLYKCGNERYLLKVIAPEYKSKLFGKGGGR
ncbi:MAG: VirB4 family type IV secretion system protein [Saccharofermentanales bacterium]